MKKPSSLQDIIRRRQQESFVGREELVASFRHNLSLDLNDNEKRFVFNIFGQGGVGKTTLLRRFSQLLEEDQRTITIWTDENEDSVPDVMACLVAKLEKQNKFFKSFNDHHRLYRQRIQELESDPEAPQNSRFP